MHALYSVRMHLELDREACYRALLARDARFDGKFYTAVRSTGIYCRPICPARPPKIDRCIFVRSAAAAHRLGYRPCLRCRPELAPGVAGWRGTGNTVSRALHLISEDALNDDSIEGLAERVGVTARHLRRLFEQHVGATPRCVAQTQRILFAKRLLTDSSLAITDVALAAGFGSVRRFNAVIQSTFGCTPTQLRRSKRRSAEIAAALTVKLPFSPPYDWSAMAALLAARAVDTIETVEADRYRRTFAFDGVQGALEVVPQLPKNHLLATIWTTNVASLNAVVARLRRVFDLDADIQTIDSHLADDPVLADRVHRRPGVRIAGAWDEFELAVRAVLSQDASPLAARTAVNRLVSALGPEFSLTDRVLPLRRIFPRAVEIAGANLMQLALTAAQARALQALAIAQLTDPGLLQPFQASAEVVAKLEALPGINSDTARCIVSGLLHESDAFPASEIELHQRLALNRSATTATDLRVASHRWRPWRAYAAARLIIQ